MNAFKEKLEQCQEYQIDIDNMKMYIIIYPINLFIVDFPKRNINEASLGGTQKYLICDRICAELNRTGFIVLEAILSQNVSQSKRQFDRTVQRAKRTYCCYSMQDDLLNTCNASKSDFWRPIGKVGVGQSQSSSMPMEVVLENGSTSSNVTDILNKWD